MAMATDKLHLVYLDRVGLLENLNETLQLPLEYKVTAKNYHESYSASNYYP